MSDPFSTLAKAVTKAVTDTAKQGNKTANDVAEGAAKSLDEFTTGMNQELDDVGKAAKDGNFAGALVESLDLFTPGTIGANALAATGFIPNDPLVKEVASGALNFMAGNPIGALKDLGDAFGALSSGSRTSGRPAESHRPPPPSSVFGGVAIAAASATATVSAFANGGYASINVNMNIGLGPQLRAATTLHAKLNVCMAHSPICRPPGAAIRDAIHNSMKDKGIVQKGPSDPNQPLGERSISDILNDKSLSFEDMVALVMFKVCQDERAKVEAEMAKLTGGGDKAGGDKKASGGKGKAETSGASAGGQANEGSPLGGLLGGGGGGGFDLGSVAKLALASVAGGPLGVAAVFASDPQMLSGAIGMAKGLAPALAPVISGALMAVPPIGPLIAPFVPMLLPMVLDVAEQAAGGMAGAGGAAGGQEAQGSSSEGVADRSARGSAKGKELMKKKKAAAGGAGKADKNESTSRQETMEMIKIMMQRLQEMQQALSNVLNSMHQGAMNAIRNIK